MRLDHDPIPAQLNMALGITVQMGSNKMRMRFDNGREAVVDYAPSIGKFDLIMVHKGKPDLNTPIGGDMLRLFNFEELLIIMNDIALLPSREEA